MGVKNVQQLKIPKNFTNEVIKKKNTKLQKHVCRTYKKSKPPPGCEGVDGCRWIPKVGCLEDDEEATELQGYIKEFISDVDHKYLTEIRGTPSRVTK